MHDVGSMTEDRLLSHRRFWEVLVSWTFVLVRARCRGVQEAVTASSAHFFELAAKDGQPPACGRFPMCLIALSSGGDYDEA